MTPEDLVRLSTLLDEALDLDESGREAWLAALPGDAAELGPTLRKLLAQRALQETGDLLDRPPAFTLPAATGAPATAFVPGDTVGPYRLLRSLGHGGMGEVWQAERADGALKRKVALKLPHVTWAPGLAERFAREREILASLEHPNIARLYDAGLDPHGRPYMALEYVEGVPIDEFCRRRTLSVEGRLQLLLQVADAVAFAHSRLVIHRDLKPGNILVTDDGKVRLLDFGIAKLMEGDATQETALTRVGGRALTLDYASPEQIRGEPIGTRSDVYSLAVVAFELLAGVRPYRLKRGSAAELEEAITHADAPLASAVVENVAHRKQLAGDVDAILNKALKKDPAERYPTVDALAQDWRRHLDGHAVSARPDTLAYRLNRLLQRHRVPVAAAAVTAVAFGLALGVGATALVIFVLALGLVAALWQARRAQEQARIARAEAKTAEAVQEFLEGIFRTSAGDQADPIKARQRTAMELLDEGAMRIDKELDDAPQAKLRVLRTLASIYEDLGDIERMASVHAKRVEVIERTTTGASEEHARALADLAGALAVIGRDADALARLAQAESILADLPGAHDDTHIAVELALADYFGARADLRGLEPARRAATRLRARSPSIELMGALMLQGKFEHIAARPADAVRTLRESVAIARHLPGGGENGVGVALLELSLAEASAGEAKAAEDDMREALRVVESNAGASSPMAIILLGRLSHLLTELGRPREALEPVLEARRRLDADPALAQRDVINVALLMREGRALRRIGHLDESMAQFDCADATRSRARISPSDAIWIACSRAQAFTDLGRFADAQRALSEAQALRDEFDLRAYIQAYWLAQAEIALALAHGQATDAMKCWQRFADDPRLVGHRQEGGVLAMEAEVAAANEGAAEVAEFAQRALTTLQMRPAEPNVAFDRPRLQMVLVRALRQLGRHDEALPTITEALVENCETCDPLRSPERVLALRELAQVQSARGDHAAAEVVLAEAGAIIARHRELGPQFNIESGAHRAASSVL